MRHLMLVTTSYPDGEDGSEAAGGFVADLARSLAGRLRVTVVAAARTDSVVDDGALAVRRFAVPRLPLSLLRAGRPGDWPAILETLAAGRRAVDAAVTAARPDHLLALWALPSGDWARRSGLRHGLPYSTWALGSDIWSLGRLPVVRGRLQRVLRDAAHRFADGLALAGDVERLAGRRCDFLPSVRRLPAPRNARKSGGPPWRLAFLGRWHRNKGVDLLLEALQALGDDDWQRIGEVRICGGGPLETLVRPAAARLAASGRPVSLGGYLDRQEAADLIGGADFLLLPSRIESIPVIYSDAIQVGTPLVAMPVGDLPRLFDDYPTGVLAGGVGAREFATALREALARGAPACSSGLAAAREAFDVEQSAERLATLLQTGG